MEKTYIEACEDIYQYYFKESKKDEEVILYIDDQILIEIFGKNGINIFLKLFIDLPKKILKDNQIRTTNYISTIEELSGLLLNRKKIFWIYIDSNSIKRTQSIDPNSIEYNKFILLLIILLIYAENTEKGVFLDSEEAEIVGKQQIIRKNGVELLIELSKKFKDNPENGYFEATNIFDRIHGNYKYVGYFKYHTPLTRLLFNEIQQIKNQHGILYEMKDTNRMDLLFKDILDKRFSKNKELGYIIINKVIDGTYNIVLSNSTNYKKQITSIGNNESVFITPSIFINEDNITKLLRIHCECELNHITLNIDGEDKTIDLTKYPQYKSIIIEKWPEKIEANNFKVHYEIPENIFFIPIKFNDIWNNINRNEFIANKFSYANKPCYYLTNDNKKFNSLTKKSIETIWSKFKNDDYFKTDECKTNIFITSNGFKTQDFLNTLSSISILDHNFYLKRYSNKWSYPYYFLPKIAISKQDDESFFYQINDDLEIQINQNEFDLDTIENLNFGKLKLYLKNNSNKKIEFSEKIIELSSEPEQKSSENSITYPVPIHKHRTHSISSADIIGFKDSFLARILYTVSNNKDIKLTEKFIYKIIDEVLIKSNQFELLNSYLDKMNIIRDLIALGFIIKNDNIYEIRDLALIQTNYKSYNFRLSGSRNYDFLMKILLQAKENGIDVNIIDNITSEIQKLLLPKDIYFTFKDKNQFDTFLNTRIHEKKLINFIKIVPYVERKFDNLTIANDNKIYEFIQDTPVFLNSIEIDNKNYYVIIEGENKLISQKNGKSKYLRSKIDGFGDKYFKIKNYDLAVVNALSLNEIPYIFTKCHGGKSTEYGNLLLLCNYPYKIPQEFYTNLVYINGGLPEKIKLKSDCLVTNLENIKLDDLTLANSYKKNGEIDFYYFKNIPVINEVKQSFAKQLKTKLYYIKYDDN